MTLEESYNLAAVYSQRPLEIHRCDKPTGKMATAKWIFPELGEIDAAAPQPERLQQMAALMTHPENGRLTRTIVNRLWSRLMGRGVVHPVDAMHTEPWSEDLLDYLAVHLADNDYNIKKTLRLIVTSHAYQSECAALADDPAAGSYRHAGPLGKRMTAEQFLDSIWSVTGAWPGPDPRAFKRDGRGQGGQLADIVGVGQTIKPVEAKQRWGSRSVRAVFTPLDALQASLGRPIREQVVTDRPTRLTTLEAINLSNGAIMADLMRKAAAKQLAEWKSSANTESDSESLVRRLFLKALARDPTNVELQTCQEILGEPPTQQGLEDLLWTVFMLPEFQIIR